MKKKSEKPKSSKKGGDKSKMEDIIQEKISADHLLYVSLKYTKTCDVIMNLILRWTRMIETSIEKILEHAKKKKKIPSVSTIDSLFSPSVSKIFPGLNKKAETILPPLIPGSFMFKPCNIAIAQF